MDKPIFRQGDETINFGGQEVKDPHHRGLGGQRSTPQGVRRSKIHVTGGQEVKGPRHRGSGGQRSTSQGVRRLKIHVTGQIQTGEHDILKMD